MLIETIPASTEDIQMILDLQQKNLKGLISAEEKEQQGFVTLQHDLGTLQQMHTLAPSVIIKDNDKVVAYALSELKECRELVPDLEPMFTLFDSLSWNGKPLNDYRYYVMGQICIDKAYRGQGLFERLYAHHKSLYQSKFDLFVTEISTSNYRSLRAHERVGFQVMHMHRDSLDEWVVVGWDWK